MRSYLPFFCLLLVFKISGQDSLSAEWVVRKSSPAGLNAMAWGLDLDAQNHVWWCPSIANSQAEGLRIYCEPFDFQGNAIWAAPLDFGGGAITEAFTVVAQNDAVYVGGRQCPGLINTCEQLLFQIDPADNSAPDWAKTWGGNGYDELDGLSVRPGDGIYTGGWWGPDANTLYDADLALRKTDLSGNTLWAAQPISHLGTAEHQDGHFVVDEAFIYACGMSGGTSFFNLYEGRSFLAKCSKSDGSLVDSVQFGSQNPWLDWNNAFGMTSDGDALYLTGTYGLSANDNQIFVAKFSKNLDLQWFTLWGGDATETARAIKIKDGRVWVGGATNSSDRTVFGAYDACLLAFDATDGQLLAAKVWGDERDNEIRDLALSADAVFLSGTSAVNLFNATHSDMEAFLLRTDQDGFLVAAQEPEASTAGFDIFPNPASGEAYLQLRKPEEAALVELFDCSGKKVFFRKENECNALKIIALNLGNLPAGVYLCRVRTAGFSGSELLLIR